MRFAFGSISCQKAFFSLVREADLDIPLCFSAKDREEPLILLKNEKKAVIFSLVGAYLSLLADKRHANHHLGGERAVNSVLEFTFFSFFPFNIMLYPVSILQEKNFHSAKNFLPLSPIFKFL